MYLEDGCRRPDQLRRPDGRGDRPVADHPLDAHMIINWRAGSETACSRSNRRVRAAILSSSGMARPSLIRRTPIPATAVTSPSSEISTIGARSWQKCSPTRAQALRKKRAQAPDQGNNKILIPDMMDERDKALVGGKHGEDASFRRVVGKYPFAA